KKRGIAASVCATNYGGLDLLPASLAYRNLDVALSEYKNPTKRLGKLLQPLVGQYDLVFLDCAPNLSVTSENIFGVADWLLVPIIPTPLSVRAYEQVRAFRANGEHSHAKLLPFFSMVDRRRQLHCELVSSFAVKYPEVLRSFIPYASQIERMGEQRAPIQSFAPASPGARAFVALWTALCVRLAITPCAGSA
ncbi:MAG: ParA family protein, partial [Gammaproteobacteria bacterium]